VFKRRPEAVGVAAAVELQPRRVGAWLAMRWAYAGHPSAIWA